MTDLNISIGLIDLTRESPRLVSSGEILRQRVKLPGLVIIHPLRLLLHWCGPRRFVDLEMFVILSSIQPVTLPWEGSGIRSGASPSRNSQPCSYQKHP